MAELKCAATNCSYNVEHCCSKGDIMVGGSQAEKRCDTCCESFVDRSKDTYKSALDHACRTISIDCEACNCSYNSGYKCHAAKVDIGGAGACNCGDTECDTFHMKR